jgi:hypothetical protein
MSDSVFGLMFPSETLIFLGCSSLELPTHTTGDRRTWGILARLFPAILWQIRQFVAFLQIRNFCGFLSFYRNGKLFLCWGRKMSGLS